MPKTFIMNYCTNCGAPLKEGAGFCTSCGQPIAQSAQPSAQNTYNQNQYNGGSYAQPQPSYTQQPPYAQQPPQQAYAYGGYPPYQQPQKKKGGCCLVALIVLLVILAALGIGGYFLYKYAKDKFEDAKDMIEGTIGVPLSSIISSENKEELEKLGVTSEDIGKIKEMAEKNDKPNKAKKSQSAPQIKLKYEMFFDETLPFPDFGEITVNSTDFGTQTIRMDKISYAEFVEYCKLLEAQPGWEAHKEDNVAHFPKDYNDKMQTMCVGDYHGLHVVVCYLCDSFVKDTDMPHVRISVNKNR